MFSQGDRADSYRSRTREMSSLGGQRAQGPDGRPPFETGWLPTGCPLAHSESPRCGRPLLDGVTVNRPTRSGVGRGAFRGVDDETYDAVYFRPFNFVADNDLSRSHMVQYISHPQYTWSRLREEHTDEYENPLPRPPDPDEFFKARIVVSKPEIRVYVGDETPGPYRHRRGASIPASALASHSRCRPIRRPERRWRKGGDPSIGPFSPAGIVRVSNRCRYPSDHFRCW